MNDPPPFAATLLARTGHFSRGLGKPMKALTISAKIGLPAMLEFR
jgi:hypothetical protein